MTAISLVVASRNRALQLNSCLSHINEVRTSAQWELIVVDNASTDNTPEVLRRFERSASFPVTVVTEPVPGLGRAHNRGWRVAKGEIVAFTDDDCYVLPDLLDQAVEVFADPRIGYCGGRIKLYDRSDHPIATNHSTVPLIFPPRSYLEFGIIQGANMMFRKRALEDIEGFDDTLGPGTPFNCEDLDACARASFSGWWGAYAPGPTVFHAHGRKATDVPALFRSYAIGRGAYAAKFILRRDTRLYQLRYWLLKLPERLIKRGHRRDCLHEIQGALWYCCHRARALCGIG
jgi:GT2 family glycosyltransferase